MGFRGVINVILRKQIEMSRSFSLFQPHPPPSPPPLTPHPTTTRCSRAICFFKFFFFILMHRLLPFPKKKTNFGKKKVTLDPRQKDRLFSEQAFPFSPPPSLLCSRPNFLEDLVRKLLQRRLPAEVLNVMITAVAKNKKVKTVIVQKTELVLIWWCQQGLEEEECSPAG